MPRSNSLGRVWCPTEAQVSIEDAAALAEPQAIERRPFGWVDTRLAEAKAEREREAGAVIR